MNSFENVRQFLADDTTVIQNFEDQDLEFPSITICNHSGFKNIEPNLKMTDYLAHTIGTKEMFNGLIPPHVSIIYSKFYGQCFTVIKHDQVFYEEYWPMSPTNLSFEKTEI
jgi:hypothetical protein